MPAVPKFAHSLYPTGALWLGFFTFCHNNTAHLIAPKTVVVRTLHKTATGKNQKFIPRIIARETGSQP